MIAAYEAMWFLFYVVGLMISGAVMSRYGTGAGVLVYFAVLVAISIEIAGSDWGLLLLAGYALAPLILYGVMHARHDWKRRKGNESSTRRGASRADS